MDDPRSRHPIEPPDTHQRPITPQGHRSGARFRMPPSFPALLRERARQCVYRIQRVRVVPGAGVGHRHVDEDVRAEKMPLGIGDAHLRPPGRKARRGVPHAATEAAQRLARSHPSAEWRNPAARPMNRRGHSPTMAGSSPTHAANRLAHESHALNRHCRRIAWAEPQSDRRRPADLVESPPPHLTLPTVAWPGLA